MLKIFAQYVDKIIKVFLDDYIVYGNKRNKVNPRKMSHQTSQKWNKLKSPPQKKFASIMHQFFAWDLWFANKDYY
jgi:hypothetical protein